MQKKYVLPILMVAPAIPALQAINIPAPNASADKSDWSFAGVTAGELTFDEGLISSPLGGKLETTIAKLNKGNYKLSLLAGTTNAVVSINGTKCEIKDNAIAFALPENGDVTITVVGDDPTHAFSFGIAKFELVFDFEAAKGALEDQFGKIAEIAKLLKGEESEYAKERAALVEESTKLQAAIGDIAETGTAADDLKTYNDNEFYNDYAQEKPEYTANKLAKAIADLSGKVDEFNKKVEPENEAEQIKLDNATIIEGLNTDLTALEEALAEINTTLNGAEATEDTPAVEGASDYVKGNNLEKYNELKAAADELREYVDGLKEATEKIDAEEQTKQIADLTKEAADLATAIADDKADEKAYGDYTNLVFDLTTAHSTAVGGIEKVITDRKLTEDEVAKQKEALWKKQLADIVAAAKETAGIGTTIKGAADKLADAETAFNNAKDQLTTAVESAGILADEYVNAVAAYNGLDTQFKELNDMAVPQSMKEDYDEKVAAITDALTGEKGMQPAINAAFLDGTLTADTYATAAEEIQGMIDDLSTYLEPLIAANKVISELEEALAAAQKCPETAEESVKAGWDFSLGKFAQNIASIQAGIDKFKADIENAKTPDDIPALDGETVKDLQTAIDLLTGEKGIAKLADIYGRVADFDKDFKAELAKVDAYADKLTRLEGNEKTWVKFTADENQPYKGLKEERDQFNEKYAAAKAEGTTPEECYNNFVALNLDYAFEDVCAETIAAYCKYVAEGNVAVAQTQVDGLKKIVTEDLKDCPGATKVDFTDIDTTLGKLDAEAAAVNNDETAEACTDKVKEALKTIGELKTTVEGYQNDHKAYTELNNSVLDKDGKNLFDAALTAAEETNENVSLETAKAHYTQVIADLQKEYDDLFAAINKAHKEDFSLLKKNDKDETRTNQQVFQAQIDDLLKRAQALSADIEANHKALQDAITAGENTRVTIVDLIKKVDGYTTNGVGEKDDHDFVGDKDTALEQLTEILNSIDNINADAATAYGEGTAAEGDFIKQFNGLADEANKIFEAFDKVYGENLVLHNNEVKAAQWDALYASLDGIHNECIRTFDNYNNIQNKNYKAELQATLDEATNLGLFDYAKQIRDLKVAFDTWFATTTDAESENYGPIADDNAKLKEYIDQANLYITEMNAKADEFKAKVAAIAETYYQTRSGEVEDAITEANTRMEGAGITDENAVKAGTGLAQAGLDDAKAAYKNATDPEEVEGVKPEPADLGLAMDGIATQLDNALAAINLQLAAETQWKANYDKAVEDLAEFAEKLKTFEFATQAERDAAALAIDAATTGAEKLNNEAKANKDLLKDKATTERGLVDYTADLKKLMDEAETKTTAAETTHKNAVDNKALYDDFIADYTDFNDQLEALRGHVSNFAGDYTTGLNAAVAEVEKFKSEVEAKKGDLTTNKDYINNLKTNAQNSIDGAYASAKTNEVAFINAQLDHVKTVYNDAKAAAEDADQAVKDHLVELENQIREIELLIKGRKAEAGATPDAPSVVGLEALAALDFTAENNGAFKNRAKVIIDTLDNLEAELDATAVDAARAALDAVAAEVNKTIDAGKTALDNCEESVQTEFAGAYDEFTKQVEALQNQWKEGNSVLSQKGNLTRQLNEIKAAAEAKAAEIAAADKLAKEEAAKIAASDARYAELNKEYEDLTQALADLETRLEGFGVLDSYQSTFAILREDLENAKEKLDAAKENHSLTADSQLGLIYNIQDWIDNTEFRETQWYFINTFNNQVAGSITKIDNAVAALAGVNQRLTPSKLQEINGDKTTISDDIQDLIDAYNAAFEAAVDQENPVPVTVEMLDGFIKDANDIISFVNNVLAKIESSKFRAGDVDVDDDVTVADIQSVLNWIGNRVEYTELLAHNERAAAAADINGDEFLNIGDATAIVNLSLGYDPSSVRFAMGKRTNAGTHHIFAELVSEENGVSRYAINLLNSEVFVAGQFDLNFPAGTMIKDITLGERAASHDLYTFDNNGSVRVIVASMENAAIQGSNGALIYVDVMNDGNLTVDEAIFADSQARTYGVGGNGTSSMDVIRENLRDLKETIYNAAGQTLNRVQRGINIIRKSDGTTTKEYRK